MPAPKITDARIKGFIKHPHLLGHYLGYDLLSEIHSKWIWDCWDRDTNYSLQAHRNSYKTTAVLVVGAIWWLLFGNPNERILFLRKSWDKASETVQEIKLQYESAPLQVLYEDIFNLKNIRGTKWSESALNLVTKNEIKAAPNIACMGVGGNITGSHPSKIFADDIITLKDRISRAERKNTIIYLRELANIPTIDGNIVYTGTPWHPEDGWKKIPEPVKYPVGSIDIKGFTKAKLAEYKSQLGSSLYAANYDLLHIADEDRLFGEPVYAPWPEKFKRINAWLDPAYAGKSTTALSMLGKDMDGKPYLRGWVWHKHIVDVYDTIVELLMLYKCGTLYVETNADKGFSKKDLSEKYPSVIGRNETANKHIKIVSFLKNNWKQIVFAEDCQPEYMNQILDYNEDADLKDGPDSAASLIREMGIGGENKLLKRFGLS